MNIENLKTDLEKIKQVRNEIKALVKGNRLGYSLHDYIEHVYTKITWGDGDHYVSDKYFMPYSIVTSELNELMNMDSDKFNSNFAKNKSKLLSVINRYIKEMEIELQNA